MSAGTEKQPLTADAAQGPAVSSSSSTSHRSLDCCLAHIKTITRLFGLGVVAVLWAATVTTLRGDYKVPTYVGYYLLAASLLVTIFEITWILDKMACCVREGCCCRCWSVIMWVDGWRKFVLYVALSVPLFLQGLDGVFQIVCGFLLLVLACLYLLKSFSSLRITTTTTTTQRHEERRTVVQATRRGEQSSTVSAGSDPELRHVAVTVRHEMSTQTNHVDPTTPPPSGIEKKKVVSSPPPPSSSSSSRLPPASSPPPPPPSAAAAAAARAPAVASVAAPNPFDETEDDGDGDEDERSAKTALERAEEGKQ